MSDDNNKSNLPSWDRLQADLRSAVEGWDSLSNETDGRLAPDEKKLAELRRLLTELEGQVRSF